jgi:hypothetical protein
MEDFGRKMPVKGGAKRRNEQLARSNEQLKMFGGRC